MRLSKLLTCFLLICALALPMALGESEGPIVTEAPTQNPTETPTEKPTEAPTQEPTEEPTQAPTEVPTESPTEEPNQAPAEEPTETPVEEPTEAPTEAPTQEPADGPTETPTENPTEQPTDTPSQEATSEPTQAPEASATTNPATTPESSMTPDPAATPEPSMTPDPAATPEPSTTPDPATTPESSMTPDPTTTPEPSMTPDPTTTPEPSMTPDPTTTPEPSMTPDPTTTPEPTFPPPTEPGVPGEWVVITCEGNAKLSDGVWAITMNTPDASIGFSWTVDGTAEMFYLFADSDYLGETAGYRTSIPSQAYMNGQHTLYVGALLDDGSLTWGAVNFRIASGGKPNGGFPGGRPSSGGRPSGGSRPSGGDTDGVAAEEQGFRVTPGKALTSKHSSGMKDAASYTRSEIIDSEEATTALYLSSTQTEITLDNGASFHVSEEDGRLNLFPDTDGKCWYLNALAMNTLADSSIGRVVFHLGGTAYSLPTRMKFSGSIYASLRARGYVSKDMEIRVDEEGVHVSVADGIYSISDNGELVPCEE